MSTTETNRRKRKGTVRMDALCKKKIFFNCARCLANELQSSNQVSKYLPFSEFFLCFFCFLSSLLECFVLQSSFDLLLESSAIGRQSPALKQFHSIVGLVDEVYKMDLTPKNERDSIYMFCMVPTLK